MTREELQTEYDKLLESYKSGKEKAYQVMPKLRELRQKIAKARR